MPYTSFAVAGAGPTIGTRIVQALIKSGGSVIVLARPGSTSTQSPLLEGAKIITVDYTDVKALTPILRENNVEVVISTLAYAGLTAQRPIADAAKEAGVKLFVPSEFGMPTEGAKEGHHLKIKADSADYAKSIGLGVLRIYNGMLAEFIPWLTCVELGKFYLLGKHTVPSSFTSREDLAGYVAHILTTLPNESLDATFRIEGNRTSLAAIGELFAARDPSVPVVHVTKLPEGYEKQAFLQSKFEEGRASSGWDNFIDRDIPEISNGGNKAWEGHKWRSVKEVLDASASKAAESQPLKIAFSYNK